MKYIIPNKDAIIYQIVTQGRDALEVVSNSDLSINDMVIIYSQISDVYFKKGLIVLGESFLKLANAYNSLLYENDKVIKKELICE